MKCPSPYSGLATSGHIHAHKALTFLQDIPETVTCAFPYVPDIDDWCGSVRRRSDEHCLEVLEASWLVMRTVTLSRAS